MSNALFYTTVSNKRTWNLWFIQPCIFQATVSERQIERKFYCYRYFTKRLGESFYMIIQYLASSIIVISRIRWLQLKMAGFNDCSTWEMLGFRAFNTDKSNSFFFANYELKSVPKHIWQRKKLNIETRQTFDIWGFGFMSIVLVLHNRPMRSLHSG